MIAKGPEAVGHMLAEGHVTNNYFIIQQNVNLAHVQRVRLEFFFTQNSQTARQTSGR